MFFSIAQQVFIIYLKKEKFCITGFCIIFGIEQKYNYRKEKREKKLNSCDPSAKTMSLPLFTLKILSDDLISKKIIIQLHLKIF